MAKFGSFTLIVAFKERCHGDSTLNIYGNVGILLIILKRFYVVHCTKVKKTIYKDKLIICVLMSQPANEYCRSKQV